MRNNEIDIAVIGSGPAGAQAAAEAVYNGAKVTLFDIGHEDKIYEPLIPESSFSEIRKIDPKQSHYFLGENFKNISSKHEAGIHLSPGRMSAITEGKKIFSTECHNFHILQSSALGGLGAAWGANCFEYDAHELERMGLPGADVQAMYPIITREIGVSGPKNSDLSNFIGTFDGIQPSLPLDSNAQKIFSNYMKRKALLNTRGFNLGQSVLATLSKPLKDREANPLYDMDFYANFGESVYRPKQTVSELLLKENFTYSPYSICQRIESIEPNNVQLYFKNSLNRAQNITCRARRVILAAGAIGSAQILLSSLGENNARLPLLCNRNHWIASLNLKMLGAKAGDRRHSLSQLTAIQTHPLNPNENIVAHFYSYRSLLLYRLIQESPFLPRTSLYLARLVMNALTMVNIHFQEEDTPLANIVWSPQSQIKIEYRENSKLLSQHLKLQKMMLKNLILLGLIPLRVTVPTPGSSVHYAGSLPVSDSPKRYSTQPSGELWDLPGVYVADSSPWRHLPAKGLTFTIMANARRVAKGVCREL